jgi:hypothetical protein
MRETKSRVLTKCSMRANGPPEKWLAAEAKV